MKIICVGRNYKAHAHELGNELTGEPIIFIKPSTAIFYDGRMQIPAFTKNLHYELEVVVKIAQKAKSIQVEEAKYFYQELTLGIDFTARDVQDQLKQKSLPWEKAKAFDQSAFVSKFIAKENFSDQTIFELYVNQERRQAAQLNQMIFSIDEIIAHASQYFTLETGDLIFTGTPSGVGPITSGDVLRGYVDGKEQFNLNIYA